jgi:uncharacterized SAM-binding protein YcdF (DUF218 family)
MPDVSFWTDPAGVPVRIFGRHRLARDYAFALGVARTLFRERRRYQIVYFLMQGLHLAAGLPVARLLGKPVVMKVSGSGIITSMRGSWLGRLELRFLIAYGVPESATLVENRSTSTHESAAFAKPLLARLSGPFVLLTSDFHMLRASRCFAHEKIHVATRPVPDILKRSGSLQFRWECFWILVEEIGKLGYYGARGWL